MPSRPAIKSHASLADRTARVPVNACPVSSASPVSVPAVVTSPAVALEPHAAGAPAGVAASRETSAPAAARAADSAPPPEAPASHPAVAADETSAGSGSPLAGSDLQAARYGSRAAARSGSPVATGCFESPIAESPAGPKSEAVDSHRSADQTDGIPLAMVAHLDSLPPSALAAPVEPAAAGSDVPQPAPASARMIAAPEAASSALQPAG